MISHKFLSMASAKLAMQTQRVFKAFKFFSSLAFIILALKFIAFN